MENMTDSRRFCDVVMKGGITSGVVYPLAIVKLAENFIFKNIGGTSAGAIAAAAAAAAECGRRNGKSGFPRLASLPTELGEIVSGNDTRLFRFFQPQPETRQLFNVLAAALGNKRSAAFRIAWASCRNFLFSLLLGLVPGLILVLVALLDPDRSALFWLVIVIGAVTALIGSLGSVSIAFLKRFLRVVPSNFYGLCTGMPNDKMKTNKEGALTPWLDRYLNLLAGRADGGPPLTFGDLWGTTKPGEEPDINLQMISTCLTHGRPYRLPFREDEDVHESNLFSFKPEEFRKLFPDTVVNWMQKHPHKSRHQDRYTAAGVVPMPEPRDLPVVVAVRMSLSFPVLLSAVPLYAIDFSRTNEADQVPERCWFSDGGISSNFPIHFFDSPLPRWPTFCIDLCDKHPDASPESVATSTMVNGNKDGIIELWNRFDQNFENGRFVPKKPGQKLTSFLSTIIHTMQNWTDSTQSRLPGFRDRIAHVSLSSEEGGLNLNMPPKRIKSLSDRGQKAGELFLERFGTTERPPMNWKNHCWVRFRTQLALIEEMLCKIESAWTSAQAVNYGDWLEGRIDPPSYDWAKANNQRQTAIDLTHHLIELAHIWVQAQSKLTDGSPRPRPEHRSRPRI
jgi:Patatin-like phospholipase